jgi:hypothetical protein
LLAAAALDSLFEDPAGSSHPVRDLQKSSVSMVQTWFFNSLLVFGFLVTSRLDSNETTARDNTPAVE